MQGRRDPQQSLLAAQNLPNRVPGDSCAFLTPISHQSNTVVMGTGCYEFGDYWRMGLLPEIIVVLVAIPLILLVWRCQPNRGDNDS